MGINESKDHADEGIKNNIAFRCIYEVKDNSEIQIINCRGKYDINDEIKSKIKVLKRNKVEDLFLQKKFDKTGLEAINFIVEGKLTNLSYMFHKCSSLKKIEFISFDTSEVANMEEMFSECNGLEYLDLSNFNTSKVMNMKCMFYNCVNLKEIKGINNFITLNVTSTLGMFLECCNLKCLDYAIN